MRRRAVDALAVPDVDTEVVVVAARGHEGSRPEVGLDLEAQDVAVEGQRSRDVADVQMEVTHAQALADEVGRVLAGDGVQEAVEVQRAGAAVVAQAGRPLGAVAIPRQLDPVAVGVGQVDRLVGAVIRGALDRGARGGQPDGGAGQLLARGVQERIVVQAGVASRAARLRILVQHDDGLGPVAELSGGGLVAVDAQAQRSLVPGDGAVQAGDREVDGAEPQRGRQRRGDRRFGGLDRSHASSLGAGRAVLAWAP